MPKSKSNRLMLLIIGMQLFFTQINFLFAQIQNFHIGTKWIYETEEGPLPIQTSFEIFQITDTIQLHGKSVFVIENGFGQEVEYMHVEDSRVYFWDDGTSSFQLTYDFESDSLYRTNWHACSGNDGKAIIRIDSVTSFIHQGDVLEIQHIRIENSGSTTDDITASVYKNIGLKEFGLRLPLGHDVCDFNTHITKLRCFESDSVHYNFVDYDCDSTWLSLPTVDVQEINTIIYPNPTSGFLRIADIEDDVPFELYDLRDMKIQSGITRNGEISIDQQGIFILRIFLKNKWITKRIVVIQD